MLFEKTSVKITNILERQEIIDEDDREICAYGLRQAFFSVLNAATALLIGFLMKMPVQAVAFTAAYIPIRIYAGGYHASSAEKCWAFSAVMLMSALCIIRIVPDEYQFCITALAVISGLIIIYMSPVEDSNKPLDKDEIKVYHLKTIDAVLIEFIIVASLYILGLKSIVVSAQTAWCSLAVMMIMGRIKNHNLKQ